MLEQSIQNKQNNYGKESRQPAPFQHILTDAMSQ